MFVNKATSNIVPSDEIPSPPEKICHGINPKQYLDIVKVIEEAKTLDSLFSSVMETLPGTIASYHHFPSIGAFDYYNFGNFYGHNLPAAIEAHYKGYDTQTPDPAIIRIFEGGRFIWLSDLAVDPKATDKADKNLALEAIKLSGDGLCIPLFGPNNRRGYMFLSGNLTKENAGEHLPYQVQALAQLLHLRYCRMITKFHKQVHLTRRETEILELVTYGKTNQDIALILDISANTVASRLKSIFIKLDVSDRVSASMRAQSTQVLF